LVDLYCTICYTKRVADTQKKMMKTNNPANYDIALSLVKKTELTRDTNKLTKGRKLKVYWGRTVPGLHEKLSSIADRVVITDRIGPYRGFDVVSYYFYNR